MPMRAEERETAEEQHDSVESLTVEFFEHTLKFDDLKIHLEPNALQLILHQNRARINRRVAGEGSQCEGKRRAIFGVRLERVLGRHGLRILGLHYRSDVLRDLYLKRGGITLPARVDPQDIGAISVEIDGTWHEAPAATAGFNGVRLIDYQALCEQLAKRYADQALLSQDIVFDALRAIQSRASAAERAATFLARFAEPDDIARAERNLRTFTIPSDAEFAGMSVADPFSSVIPTGSHEPLPEPGECKSGTPAPRKGPGIGFED